MTTTKTSTDIWKIAESMKLLKKVLCHFSKKEKTAAKSVFFKTIREAKTPLIKAIDKDTGRIVLPMSSLPVDPKTVRSRFAGILVAYGISSYFDWITAEELNAGQISEPKHFDFGDGYGKNHAAGVKKGMKIGRAMTAVMTSIYKSTMMRDRLKHHGAFDGLISKMRQNQVRKGGRLEGWPSNAEIIAAFVTDVCDKYKTPNSGFLVLSANPLDILLSSEAASFHSCHSLGGHGSYRAGNLQYLCDPHTAIAYYYKEERVYSPAGCKLPHKLWRQLVHFDLADAAAALMRKYPSPTAMPEALPDALDILVADALAKACGRDKTFVTDKATAKGSQGIFSFPGVRLAYMDHFADHAGHTVALLPEKDGIKIPFAKEVPCAFCSDGNLASASLLVCEKCDGITCEECKKTIRRNDAISISNDDDDDDDENGDENGDEDDGPFVCKGCYAAKYASCNYCCRFLRKEDAVAVGDRHYCQPCARDRLSDCKSCTDRAITSSMCVGLDGERYCTNCWKLKYRVCWDCGANMAIADVRSIPSGLSSRSFCQRCYSYRFSPCDKCGKECGKHDFKLDRRSKKNKCPDCRKGKAKPKAAESAVPMYGANLLGTTSGNYTVTYIPLPTETNS